MKEYICYGCNENCTWYEDKMEDMGILMGDLVCDTVCPYSGMDTEFHERKNGSEDEEDDP